MTTMDDLYGDGSDHLACEECGNCIECADCNCAPELDWMELPEHWTETLWKWIKKRLSR